MISGVRILIEGLPERVHWIADALDEVLPGRVEWCEVAVPGVDHTVSLEGTGVPPFTTTAAAQVASILEGVDEARELS